MVILIFTGWLWWQIRMEKAGEQTYYKAFNINIPNGYSINGIDVSRYQSYIYWKSVKAMRIDSVTIDFAFIKCTEGLTGKDKMFKRNWKMCSENKITKGAYHFFITTKDGVAQAENFMENAQLDIGDLPPVVDIEQDYSVDKSDIVKRLKDCLQTLELKYKVKPIIYSYLSFYNHYLADDFGDYPFWVAHYTNNEKPDTDAHWIFWQHSQEGRVNGITEKVDFNVFNGTQQQFRQLLLK